MEKLKRIAEALKWYEGQYLKGDIDPLHPLSDIDAQVKKLKDQIQTFLEKFCSVSKKSMTAFSLDDVVTASFASNVDAAAAAEAEDNIIQSYNALLQELARKGEYKEVAEQLPYICKNHEIKQYYQDTALWCHNFLQKLALQQALSFLATTTEDRNSDLQQQYQALCQKMDEHLNAYYDQDKDTQAYNLKKVVEVDECANSRSEILDQYRALLEALTKANKFAAQQVLAGGFDVPLTMQAAQLMAPVDLGKHEAETMSSLSLSLVPTDIQSPIFKKILTDYGSSSKLLIAILLIAVLDLKSPIVKEFKISVGVMIAAYVEYMRQALQNLVVMQQQKSLLSLSKSNQEIVQELQQQIPQKPHEFYKLNAWITQDRGSLIESLQACVQSNKSSSEQNTIEIVKSEPQAHIEAIAEACSNRFEVVNKLLQQHITDSASVQTIIKSGEVSKSNDGDCDSIDLVFKTKNQMEIYTKTPVELTATTVTARNPAVDESIADIAAAMAQAYYQAKWLEHADKDKSQFDAWISQQNEPLPVRSKNSELTAELTQALQNLGFQNAVAKYSQQHRRHLSPVSGPDLANLMLDVKVSLNPVAEPQASADKPPALAVVDSQPSVVGSPCARSLSAGSLNSDLSGDWIIAFQSSVELQKNK